MDKTVQQWIYSRIYGDDEPRHFPFPPQGDIGVSSRNGKNRTIREPTFYKGTIDALLLKRVVTILAPDISTKKEMLNSRNRIVSGFKQFKNP